MLPSSADLKRVLCISGSKFTCPHPHPRRGSNPVSGSPVCEFTFTTSSSELLEARSSEPPETDSSESPETDSSETWDDELIGSSIDVKIKIIAIIMTTVPISRYCCFF